MRILFVSHHHYDPVLCPHQIGGMQQVSYQLLTALKALPHVEVREAVFYAPEKGYAWSLTQYVWDVLTTLKRRVRDESIDCVLYSSMVMSGAAGLFQSSVGCVQVGICHGLDVVKPMYWYQNWALPRIMKGLDAMVAISNATQAACTQRGARHVQIIPNGISDQISQRNLTDRQAREVLGDRWPRDARKVLLTVGRVTPRKGQYWLCRHVIPKLDADTHYVIVGDGPDRSRIEDWIRRTGSTQVHAVGALQMSDPCLTAWYQCADWFIMPNQPQPNDLEGFGVVMLESNSCGTPVIAARTDGILDVITEGENGYLVEPSEPDAYVNAIHRPVLSADRVKAHVQSRFDWSAIATRYIDCIAELKKNVHQR